MAYSEIRAATCPDGNFKHVNPFGKRDAKSVSSHLPMFHNYFTARADTEQPIGPKPKVPVWGLLAEAAIEAALLETHPRAITEMAFGFAPWQTFRM